MTRESDDEYGFDSADEEALAASFDATESQAVGTKRKAPPTDEAPPSKKLATEKHPTTSPLAVTVLKQTFGFSAFRLKQEAAIARLLAGGSTIVVFPTGGGKSLCYQVPALCFDEIDKLQDIRGPGEGGITLIVSPLLALMKDQVDVLVRLGVSAACIDSGRTREEFLNTCSKLRDGSLKILYVAPERLNNEGFLEQMKYVRGGVRLLAVDEAHCISEWGHAFRPDYLKVARFADEIKAERVVCLTATATPRVAQDICDAFKVDKSGLFRTPTYRPNLHLLAESAATKQELYPRLFKFLRENPGPSIIYVTSQKQTEALADDLRRQGFKARHFHAGMPTAEKIVLQELFMAQDDLIIVATIAFGMGIDKGNVRSVIHFNIPNSLESYSQEIGRAGRDGLRSNCLFYVCGEDMYLRENFARGDLPSMESLRKFLKDIFSPANTKLSIGQTFEVSQYGQAKDFDIRQITINNIFAQLEVRFGLIRAVSPIYTKYTFTPCGLYYSILKTDKSMAAKAIFNAAEKVKTLCHVDTKEAARRSAIPRADIVKKLNDWNELHVIELNVSGVKHVYKVTQKLPSKAAEIEGLVKDLYTYMEEREQQALDRTEQVLKFVTASTCFSRALAQHFGDDLPDRKTECGHCAWCSTHKPVLKPEMPKVPFNTAKFKQILQTIPDRDDARFLARVAFGISSPRVTKLKLSREGPIFGSMADHDFMKLYRAFASACSKDNQSKSKPKPELPSTAKAATKESTAAMKSTLSSMRGVSYEKSNG